MFANTFFQNGYSEVAALASYTPDQVITSEELLTEIDSEARFGIPVSWLNDALGIKERRAVALGTNPSTLAIEAAKRAICSTGIFPEEIDLIIYCGIDKDFNEPATAHKVQAAVAPNAICFDVSSACHGFMNGVSIADSYFATSNIETALIVTGETPTQSAMYPSMELLKKKTSNKNLFNKLAGMLTVGDAGAAMLVKRKSRSSDSGFKKFFFRSDGRHADLCYYLNKGGQFVAQMKMAKISAIGTKMHQDMIDNSYEKTGWNSSMMDHAVVHQVGRKPVEMGASLAGVDMKRCPITYDMYGNTTSAAVPLTLSKLNVSKGERVLLMGAGSGLSVSQVFVEY